MSSAKAAPAKSQLTPEEESLLNDYSRNVSTKSSALFYGNAIIVAAIPTWLYWRIHQMEPWNFYIFYVAATLVATYLISFAYRNVKFVLKHKIAQKREDAIIKELASKMDKKSKKDQDDRLLWKKNEVAEFEATSYSIFYNNSLFLIILLVASFFIFKNFTPVLWVTHSTPSKCFLLVFFCCCIFYVYLSSSIKGTILSQWELLQACSHSSPQARNKCDVNQH